MTLYCEKLALSELAEQFGTPLYVYSQQALTDAYRAYTDAFGSDTLLCYAVKANGNLSILRHFASLGSGFDIVSGGELARVLAAGGDAAKTIFSGVGKSEAEIEYALKADIKCFNVESLPELDRINSVAARLGCRAPISLRINPDVDAQTHPYISTGLKANKFGIAMADGAVPRDALVFIFPADHEAGDILQEDQRDGAGRAQFDEMRGLLCGLGEQHAVVGDKAHRAALDMGETGDDGLAKARLEPI